MAWYFECLIQYFSAAFDVLIKISESYRPQIPSLSSRLLIYSLQLRISLSFSLTRSLTPSRHPSLPHLPKPSLLYFRISSSLLASPNLPSILNFSLPLPIACFRLLISSSHFLISSSHFPILSALPSCLRFLSISTFPIPSPSNSSLTLP